MVSFRDIFPGGKGRISERRRPALTKSSIPESLLVRPRNKREINRLYLLSIYLRSLEILQDLRKSLDKLYPLRLVSTIEIDEGMGERHF